MKIFYLSRKASSPKNIFQI